MSKKFLYAGYVSGKLHFVHEPDKYGFECIRPQVFKRKRDALICYEDVRKIEIKEVKK
jgi:hypothetical protein